MRTYNAAPSAASFMESLRDIGYSLETAVADILDNSITAEATDIEIILTVIEQTAQVAIIDNGKGMTEEELLVAMKPGSKNPLHARASNDLGRFGLGLKTASFSQCRKFTVVTRKNGKLSAALGIWTLWRRKINGHYKSLNMTEINEIPFVKEFPNRVLWSYGKSLIGWNKLQRQVISKIIFMNALILRVSTLN